MTGKGGIEGAGARILELRAQRGITQRVLADAAHCSASYLARIENDERRPTIQLLRQLAPHLGVSAAYLETGENVIDLRLELHDALGLAEGYLNAGVVEAAQRLLSKEAELASVGGEVERRGL